MNRRSTTAQENPSSDWLTKMMEELRRQLRETELWPKAGDLLLADLSNNINSRPKTSSVEDYDMLSIVVNDALIGVDIMKKYPAFYARMLVDEELRTAFLDTLELLEDGETEEIPEQPGDIFASLEIIKQMMSKPIIREAVKDRVVLIWRRTAEQLQTMLYLNTIKPKEVLRSGDYLPDAGHLNLLQSQFQVDDQEWDIRLEASQDLAQRGQLNLILVMQLPDLSANTFQATVSWGDYRSTTTVNAFGIGKFAPLRSDQIFTANGKLKYGFELHLEQFE